MNEPALQKILADIRGGAPSAQEPPGSASSSTPFSSQIGIKERVQATMWGDFVAFNRWMMRIYEELPPNACQVVLSWFRSFGVYPVVWTVLRPC